MDCNQVQTLTSHTESRRPRGWSFFVGSSRAVVNSHIRFISEMKAILPAMLVALLVTPISTGYHLNRGRSPVRVHPLPPPATIESAAAPLISRATRCPLFRRWRLRIRQFVPAAAAATLVFLLPGGSGPCLGYEQPTSPSSLDALLLASTASREDSPVRCRSDEISFVFEIYALLGARM